MARLPPPTRSALDLVRHPQSRRAYSSQPPLRPGQSSAVKFWPFALIVAAGFGAYALMVRQRAAASQREYERRSSGQA